MSESKERDGFDFAADPKKNFTNYLIWNMKRVFPLVYSIPSATCAWDIELQPQVLMILQSFDQKTKESIFKEEIERLKKCVSNCRLVDRAELQQICDKISSYVHESYLKDVNGYSGIDPNKESETL